MATFEQQREDARRIFANNPTELQQTIDHLDGLERMTMPAPRRAAPAKIAPIDRETAVRTRVLEIRAGSPGLSLAEAHLNAIADVGYARGEVPFYTHADVATLSADGLEALNAAAERGEAEVEALEPARGTDAYYDLHPDELTAAKAELGLTDAYLALDPAGRVAAGARAFAEKQARQLADNRRLVQLGALLDDGMSREEAERAVAGAGR